MMKEADPFWRDWGLLLAYQASDKTKADALLPKFIEKNQHDSALQIAEIYAYGGETDKAFEWLERAHKQHDAGLPELKIRRILRKLHGDPRWPAFLKQMHLPLD